MLVADLLFDDRSLSTLKKVGGLISESLVLLLHFMKHDLISSLLRCKLLHHLLQLHVELKNHCRHMVFHVRWDFSKFYLHSDLDEWRMTLKTELTGLRYFSTAKDEALIPC